MLARAKQHDFSLDEALDLGLACTLRELLLHAADEHVLEVVFVAGLDLRTAAAAELLEQLRGGRRARVRSGLRWPRRVLAFLSRAAQCDFLHSWCRPHVSSMDFLCDIDLSYNVL